LSQRLELVKEVGRVKVNMIPRVTDNQTDNVRVRRVRGD
jgi:chorismate mutase